MPCPPCPAPSARAYATYRRDSVEDIPCSVCGNRCGSTERQTRMMRRSLAIVIAVLALAACTESASAQAKPPQASETSLRSSMLGPPPSPQPKTCPHGSRYTKRLHRNDVPGMHGHLVPGKPNVLVECLTSRRVLIDDPKVVAQIVDQLNALKLVKPGAVYSCPADFGPTFGLFFNYPNGDVLLVTVDASGCRFASNGQRSAFTTDALQRRIEHPLRPT